MDYIGLTVKFPVDRALTLEEKVAHLPQDKASPSDPRYQLSVIRMNSTYLECVDKYFADKGFLTTMILVLTSMIVFVYGYSIIFTLIDLSQSTALEDIGFIAALSVICLPLFYFLYTKMLKKECFTYTHFPIRFNRKTRKVHVFRFDGTVMTESWDKLYFCLCASQRNFLEVRGHRLAEDGETVLETFALPYFSTDDTHSPQPLIWTQWEFVRRYMEEGPEKLADQVEWVMDVADKRETFSRGFWRQWAEVAGLPPLALIMAPFLFLYSLGRWLATHTSKIPVWPAEIEAECQFDANDPYLRDAQHLAKPAENPYEGWR